MKYNFYNNCFEEKEKNINKIAICGSDTDIKWVELEQKVKQLKTTLLNLKLPQGHPVIIYGHKEHFYPIAILAMISLKMTYIPIDKIYPVDRVRKIIRMTGSQVLIKCGDYDFPIDVPIQIDYKFNLIESKRPCFSEIKNESPHDHVQYIMFTSGSTGEPKGVQINRSSLMSFIDWLSSDYDFSEDDVFMNQSPFTFDVSLYDILSAFMLGATVLLIDTEIVKQPDKFFDKLKKYNCSVWTSTPSFVYIFLRDKIFDSSYFSQLKTFLFAGEDLPPKTVRKLKQNFPEAKIFNAYGPTEATVTTTLIEITDDLLDKYKVLPIGYPRKDSEILIDNTENRTEEGGEIIIVGDHVSSGYFNNDDINEEKFFSYKGKRAFRTGDIGYYENNILFCIGRNDDQIKLHGYRIELGEITSVIRELDFIEDAISIPLKRNNVVKRIITFVITKKGCEDSAIELKNKVIGEIENILPPYMIPGDIISLKEFPVSISHKIDKNKLLEMYKNRNI